MREICGDNRFEIIAKAKEHLLEATNIDTAEDEMKVLDSFLYRCWQMGWLDRYDEQTEPRCDECIHFDKSYKKIDEDGTLIIGVECDGMDKVCEKFQTEQNMDCSWR